MPYCPECGTEIDENDEVCSNCGSRTSSSSPAPAGDVDAVGHLTTAFNLAMAQPMVFIPAILGGVISSVLSWIATRLGFVAAGFGFFRGFAIFTAIFGMIGAFFVYILGFATIDMGRDAYYNRSLSLGESIGYVTGRLVDFIIASVVGAILGITVILIPVVSLMFVVMVMDEVGVGTALSKSFNVITADLGDIVIVILVSIIGSALLGYVPVISGLLKSALTVVINLAFIDIYHHYRS